MAYRENNSQRRDDQVRFNLLEHIGVLSRKDSGWTREVNIVSWNGAPAKLDIREWNPEHERMSKGVTLFEEEAETLTRLLMSKFGMRMNGAGYTPREYATRENSSRENTDRGYAAEENSNDRSFFENERQPEAVSNVPEASELEMTEAAVEGSARPEPVAEIVAACVAETAAHMEEFSVGNKETAAHMEESSVGNRETAAYMEDAADGAADGSEEAEAATAEEQF
ncbi:MAG: hypothetical protein IJG48_03045 [Mogibacterium sp.]|nr:hypothetical protein [Mogibacterium sp.]